MIELIKNSSWMLELSFSYTWQGKGQKMEKISTNRKHLNLNLKHLPPIDPPTITSSSSQLKKDKPTFRYVPKGVKQRAKEGPKLGNKFDDEANTAADLLADINLSDSIKTEDDASFCIVKHIDTNNIVFKNTTKESEANDHDDDKASHHDDSAGGPNMVLSAKSQLHQTCAANKWKPPVFECFKEEGASHIKSFTYKVVVEIEGEAYSTLLETFGDPKPKKKTAAENAAEGALWYLKHLDYFPIKKVMKKGKKRNNN